jgi:hypothetical protein
MIITGTVQVIANIEQRKKEFRLEFSGVRRLPCKNVVFALEKCFSYSPRLI